MSTLLLSQGNSNIISEIAYSIQQIPQASKSNYNMIIPKNVSNTLKEIQYSLIMNSFELEQQTITKRLHLSQEKLYNICSNKIQVKAPNHFIQKIRSLYYFIMVLGFCEGQKQNTEIQQKSESIDLQQKTNQQLQLQQISEDTISKLQTAFFLLKLHIYRSENISKICKKYFAEFIKFLSFDCFSPSQKKIYKNAKIISQTLNKYPIVDEILIDTFLNQIVDSEQSIDDNLNITQGLASKLNLDCKYFMFRQFVIEGEIQINVIADGIELKKNKDFLENLIIDLNYYNQQNNLCKYELLDVSRVSHFSQGVFDKMEESFIQQLKQFQTQQSLQNSRSVYQGKLIPGTNFEKLFDIIDLKSYNNELANPQNIENTNSNNQNDTIALKQSITFNEQVKKDQTPQTKTSEQKKPIVKFTYQQTKMPIKLDDSKKSKSSRFTTQFLDQVQNDINGLMSSIRQKLSKKDQGSLKQSVDNLNECFVSIDFTNPLKNISLYDQKTTKSQTNTANYMRKISCPIADGHKPFYSNRYNRLPQVVEKNPLYIQRIIKDSLSPIKAKKDRKQKKIHHSTKNKQVTHNYEIQKQKQINYNTLNNPQVINNSSLVKVSISQYPYSNQFKRKNYVQQHSNNKNLGPTQNFYSIPTYGNSNSQNIIFTNNNNTESNSFKPQKLIMRQNQYRTPLIKFTQNRSKEIDQPPSLQFKTQSKIPNQEKAQPAFLTRNRSKATQQRPNYNPSTAQNFMNQPSILTSLKSNNNTKSYTSFRPSTNYKLQERKNTCSQSNLYYYPSNYSIKTNSNSNDNFLNTQSNLKKANDYEFDLQLNKRGTHRQNEPQPSAQFYVPYKTDRPRIGNYVDQVYTKPFKNQMRNGIKLTQELNFLNKK